MITPIDKNRENIQILYSQYTDDWNDNTGGHWVCCYYDKSKLFIYDSLGGNYRHRHHKISLEKLLPFYSVTRENITYPRFQMQPSGDDCGVFAIAFGVTLVLGKKPDLVNYNQPEMRNNLTRMLKNKVIEHFATLNGTNKNEYNLMRKRAYVDNETRTVKFNIPSENENVSHISKDGSQCYPGKVGEIDSMKNVENSTLQTSTTALLENKTLVKMVKIKKRKMNRNYWLRNKYTIKQKRKKRNATFNVRRRVQQKCRKFYLVRKTRILARRKLYHSIWIPQ